MTVPVPLLAATAELSLLWKLRWLHTDRYPQGKDLYDAVLLAEYTTVDPELVPPFPVSGVDWENFVADYPGVPGTAQHWLRRLSLALDRSQAAGR